MFRKAIAPPRTRVAGLFCASHRFAEHLFAKPAGAMIGPAGFKEKPMPSLSQPDQRTVTAPPPSPTSAKPLPNHVLSVTLEADEDVEWSWTHSADGISYVSGYSIVKIAKKDAAAT